MRCSTLGMLHQLSLLARSILVLGLLGWAAGSPFVQATERADLAAAGWAEGDDVGVSDEPVDADSDGFWSDVDCDDSNPALYPGAPQVCWDGVNNNCGHPDWPGLAVTWEERLLAPSFENYLRDRFPGDFDGDGDLDVVSLQNNGSLLVLHENVWGNAFLWTEHELQPTGWYGGDGVPADVDGDGDLDLVFSNGTNDRIEWHENVDGGGFEWAGHIIPVSHEWPTAPRAADMDGDGDLDVLAGFTDSDAIAWYENALGDGTVWTEHEISLAASDPRSVFAADLDGDGDADVVAALAGEDTIAWYENALGDGTVWTERAVSVGPDWPNSVFAVDLDGDGDTDILSTARDDDTLSWHENLSGSGTTWEAHLIAEEPIDSDSQKVLAVDVDNDGDMDAISAWRSLGTIAWHENLAGDASSWEKGTITDSARPLYAEVGDLDGDGFVDVVGGGTNDALFFWLQRNIDNGCCVDADSDGVCSSEDCDDGDPDNWVSCLTCVDADGDLHYAWCDAWETHAGPDCDDQVATCIDDCSDGDSDGLALCAGDCDDTNPQCTTDCTDDDSDGHCVTTDCDDGEAAVHPGAPQLCGDGMNNDCADPVWPSLITWGKSTIVRDEVNSRVVANADVDGDGDLDALAASLYQNEIKWHENLDGDGYAWAEHVITTLAEDPTDLFAADLDGDGDVDVLSSSRDDDTIAWYENVAGDGSEWTRRVISYVADYATGVHAADVDGDGDLDALSSSRLDHKIAWYENLAGDGSQWVQHLISPSCWWAQSVSTADVDGDGDLDVFSSAEYEDAVYWYENRINEGKVWIWRFISTEVLEGGSIHPADVDGDGDLDVVSASAGDATLAWHENVQGDGLLWTLRVISTAASSISSVWAGDLDGDGDVDAVWADARVGPDSISWHENIVGDGSLWAEREIVMSSAHPYSICVGDVDGNGRLDLLAALADEVAWIGQGWLETDDDSDGLIECEGDCDDGNPYCVTDCTDADSDGHCATHDCDEENPYCGWDCADGDHDDYCAPYDCDDSQAGCTSDCVDADSDGLAACAGDCDDANPHCATNCTDRDSDGYCITDDCDDQDRYCAADCSDADADGFCPPIDCDDGNDAVHPGSTQICDGLNNDCSAASWPTLTEWTERRVVSINAPAIQALFPADMDGDGDLDTLCGGGFGLTDPYEIAWYENLDGDGTGWAERTMISTAVDYVSSVIAADVDGDGDLDALSTSYLDDTIAWHENLAETARPGRRTPSARRPTGRSRSLRQTWMGMATWTRSPRRSWTTRSPGTRTWRATDRRGWSTR